MRMKKWMAALLAALVLALGCAGLAEADANVEENASAEEAVEAAEAVAEEDVESVSGHIAFTEDLAPYEGRWVTFEDGFKLFLPKEWSRIDLDETQQQAGLFYRAENGGSDSAVGDTAMGVAVSFVRAGELKTLDDLAADFASAGFGEINKLDINGIPCISFARAAGDYRGVAFYHPTHSNYVLAGRRSAKNSCQGCRKTGFDAEYYYQGVKFRLKVAAAAAPNAIEIVRSDEE